MMAIQTEVFGRDFSTVWIELLSEAVKMNRWSRSRPATVHKGVNVLIVVPSVIEITDFAPVACLLC